LIFVISILYWIKAQHNPITNGKVITKRKIKSFPNPKSNLILIFISLISTMVIYPKGKRNHVNIFQIKFLFNFLNLLRKIVRERPYIKSENKNEHIIAITINDLAVCHSLLKL
jgi:hypothetical protein